MLTSEKYELLEKELDAIRRICEAYSPVEQMVDKALKGFIEVLPRTSPDIDKFVTELPEHPKYLKIFITLLLYKKDVDDTCWELMERHAGVRECLEYPINEKDTQ